MTAPRVAVGLFVYNGERHIRAAIDSLLGQTMGDFVLDISDNASTDLTEEICRSYMAADSRVRYVRQPENRGLTANCNYVAQLSPDTEFFKWCAHDDVYGPTYLEQCVAELDTRPELVMCHSRTRYINEHGNEIMRSFREQAFTDERPWARLEQILLKTHDYTYSFALMRRSALNRIRPFLPVYASDAVVLSELAFQGPFGELPDHLFANRMHSNRATAVVGPKGNPAVWAKWFGGSSRFPLWHTLDALRRSISAAPLDAESKARCYAVVGRWTKGQLPEFVLDVAVGGTRAARANDVRPARGPKRMRVTRITTREELGSVQGWSELANSCDASPFTWPSICVPWWFELGFGRLVGVAVEEAGLLVGLAVVHDRVGDFGRHRFQFLGTGDGTYQQLLVADGRHDVLALLWEGLLSPGREIGLFGIPSDIARGYEVDTSCSLALTPSDRTRLVSAPVGDDDLVAAEDLGSVRRLTSPDECLDLLTRPSESARWGSGVHGTRTSAYFASAVDASARADRLTLHVEDAPDGSASGVLVLHGSATSAVWRLVAPTRGSLSPTVVAAAMSEAAKRGSRRLIWPGSADVPGDAFPLVDVGLEKRGGRIREFPGLARGAIRGFRDLISL